MKTILVAGGAGYIGSHMVALLVKRGYEVVVADNLRTGHWQAVKGARKMYVGDLRDGAFLHQIFTENKIDGVINFAAFSLVGESVTNPLKYYGNNVEGAVSLLSAMQAHGVDKIVFSSTAAAYGEPIVYERHRHRYEFNNSYRQQLEEAGLVISGTSPDGRLVEAVELPGHDFYVGVQYHPEFKSRPNRAQPLFREFIAAALKKQGEILEKL